MSVAVTGVTGFLGSHIALTLALAGVEVRGVARRPEGWTLGHPEKVSVVPGDLNDEASLIAAFAGCRAVVANAALVSWRGELDAYIATNVRGTENTLRAAAAAGAREVVLVSSVAVYRTRLRHYMDEAHPRYGPKKRLFDWSHLSTDWRYSLTKQAAEERAWSLAKELNLALTVLRPGPIYGSRDPKWTSRLLRNLQRPLTFAPSFGVPLVHAGDVARVVLRALDGGGAGRAYNLAGPPTPLREILTTFLRFGGGRAKLVPLPVPLWVGYDTRAARQDLGFNPRSLDEGVAEVLSQRADNG